MILTLLKRSNNIGKLASDLHHGPAMQHKVRHGAPVEVMYAYTTYMSTNAIGIRNMTGWAPSGFQ